MSDDERRSAPKIPRALERYPLGESIDDARWAAIDRDTQRAVVVTRVRCASKEERDALVERVRSLYAVSSPALIAALDAGAWDDDAFVVVESLFEPSQPLAEATHLDARERALAARAIAEGIAALHAAGFALDSFDVRIDGYRQPRIAIAQHTIPATDDARAADVERLLALVDTLAPHTAHAASAREIAAAIVIPAATGESPLVRASAPSKASRVWMLALLVIGVLIVLALTQR